VAIVFDDFLTEIKYFSLEVETMEPNVREIRKGRMTLRISEITKVIEQSNDKNVQLKIDTYHDDILVGGYWSYTDDIDKMISKAIDEYRNLRR
jgi:hydroxypyruvate isomerase